MGSGHRRLFGVDWDEPGQPAVDQAKGVPQPDVQKPVPPDGEILSLPDARNLTLGVMPLREAIARRRSRRQFTEQPLTLEELSFLLWATQGVTEVRQRPGGGKATIRTVPSGGARHPFETYLSVHRVTGLGEGLYRYLPLEHKLLVLCRGTGYAARVSEACSGQGFVREAAVVFVWTAIPYRVQWRYGPRATKLVGLDGGHVCQSLYLAAESIGCGTCAVGAYRQAEMDRFVGVDGEDEFVVYCAPVGRIP